MRSGRRPERRRRWAARAALGLVALSLLTATGVAPHPAPAVAQTVDEGLPDPEPDPDEVLAEADRILAGDEFGQGDDEGSNPSGVLGEGGDGGDPPDPPDLPQAPVFAGLGAVGQVIMWIIVVALGALAVWVLVRTVRLRRRHGDDGDDEDDDEDVVVLDDEDDLAPMLRPADEWRRMAAEAEAAGRWRDGLRSRYRALLADLIAAGAIDDLPGRTTGEYRLEVVASLPAAAEGFAAASELFDRAWYGARPTGADERDRFVALEADVLARAAELGSLAEATR